MHREAWGARQSGGRWLARELPQKCTRGPFRVALLIRAENQKQPFCPWAESWINQLCCIPTTEGRVVAGLDEVSPPLWLSLRNHVGREKQVTDDTWYGSCKARKQ